MSHESDTRVPLTSETETEFHHLQIVDHNDSCSSVDDFDSTNRNKHNHSEDGDYDNDDPNLEGGRQGGQSSLSSCIINLLNTVAGAGMLGLPAAYAGSGYVGGTVIMLIASFFSANGLRLLCFSAETARIKFLSNQINTNNNSEHNRRKASPSSSSTPVEYQASFYSVAQAALPEFTILIDFAVAIKCFGVATGYFITVADCMVDSFVYLLSDSSSSSEEDSIFLSRHFWVLSAFMLVLPISFFKTLDALKFTSLLSLFLIYSLAVGIILYAQGIFHPCPPPPGADTTTFHDTTMDFITPDNFYDSSYDYSINANNTTVTPATCHGTTSYLTSPTQTLSNLPIFVFSFTCHQNVFSVFNEISHRTHSRLERVISTSIKAALFLYYAVAIEGYRTFGDHVSGDILLNYPQTIEVTCMRISIAIMVILSYPLQLDPSRRSVISLVREISRLRTNRRKNEYIHMHNDGKEKNTEMPERSMFDKEDRTKDSLLLEEEENMNSFHSFEDENDDDNNPNLSDEASTSSTVTDLNEAMGVPLCDEENEFVIGGKESKEEAQLLLQAYNEFLFNSITCSFLLGSFIVAMMVSDLGVVLGVVGATGSTMVSYILPGAIYIKLHPEQRFWKHKWKFLACMQLGLGLVIVPTALYFVLFYGAAG